MFVYFLRTRRPDPRGACTASMALSCKFEEGGSAGQIRGSAQNNSRVIMA